MENRTKEINDYKRENYKRVSFEMRKKDYEEMKAHIDQQGESVNGFIKRAIKETMQHDISNDGE